MSYPASCGLRPVSRFAERARFTVCRSRKEGYARGKVGEFPPHRIKVRRGPLHRSGSGPGNQPEGFPGFEYKLTRRATRTARKS